MGVKALCAAVLILACMVSALADAGESLQARLNAAGAAGGGVVTLEAGEYEIRETLTIPRNVTLEGVWRAPVRGEEPLGGTVLLGYVGKNDEEGAPLIKMQSSAVLKGLTIFYPEQTKTNPPIPYSWTVQSDGATDNVTILDVTMVNPYQAVDLGTYPAGRHLVRNLYAHALRRGIYINQCYDVGRIENIHFWPFWDINPASPLWEYTKTHGEAFIIGKTDGQMGLNLFSIFYKISMRFIEGPIYDEDRNIVDYQAGSGMYTNCYLDVSPIAIQVDAAMEKAGISFVNSSIMSHVHVMPTNRGQVKFVGSGFWATRELREHALIEGRGTVFFEACHFSDWDRVNEGHYCIDANNRSLIVNGCEFPTTREDHKVIRLGPRMRSAIITSNLMPGGALIDNHAPDNADIQIGFNAVEAPPGYIMDWRGIGPFDEKTGEDAYDFDFLAAVGGEAAESLDLDTLEEGDFETHRLRASTRGFVNMHRLKGGIPDLTGYAYTWIQSDRAQEATFEVGINDSGKVWVNGQEIMARFNPNGRQCRPGDLFATASLNAGWNFVLVKVVDQGGRAWEFVLEAYGEDGESLEGVARIPEE